MRQLILTALIIAVGACSFKKDPEKNDSVKPTVINQQDKVPSINLESIITQSDSKKAIEELSKIKIENINGKNTSDGTLLDTAIRLEKIDLINYLVLRGSNAFQLSEESYKKMEHNQSINDAFASLHKDIFFNILNRFPSNDGIEESDYDDYDKALSAEKMGPIGCLKYIDFLMNIKFFWRKPTGAGIYYEGATTKNIESVVLRTLNVSECSQYKKQFNLIKVSEWISNEFIHQFYQDFESSDFIKFLLTLPKERFLKITITNSFDDQLPRQLRIDPLAFIVVKKPCMEEENFNSWYGIFNKLEKGGYNYSDTFQYKTDEEIKSCSEDEFCSDPDGNWSTLTAVFNGLLKKNEDDLSTYERYVSSMNNAEDELNEDDLAARKKIKKLVCKHFYGEKDE
ncbi:hypothetical protein [Bdellovibrio sp. HCB-162]|uniref:hypothetical protein n=1 Tax=Bdellovibrio sp. HCB-162 TaxID=3394234 RepID=UPI0039BC9FAC